MDRFKQPESAQCLNAVVFACLAATCLATSTLRAKVATELLHPPSRISTNSYYLPAEQVLADARVSLLRLIRSLSWLKSSPSHPTLSNPMDELVHLQECLEDVVNLSSDRQHLIDTWPSSVRERTDVSGVSRRGRDVMIQSSSLWTTITVDGVLFDYSASLESGALRRLNAHVMRSNGSKLQVKITGTATLPPRLDSSYVNAWVIQALHGHCVKLQATPRHLSLLHAGSDLGILPRLKELIVKAEIDPTSTITSPLDRIHQLMPCVTRLALVGSDHVVVSIPPTSPLMAQITHLEIGFH
ncbi:hypothetical protein FA15DRAFT_710363 [Coprinopsis marcescibilis]|uniref:Uncharacterized protein n=1 Tax=Coprinopsis marcescibilis TaxID=230819 RepID=A0A5C3KCW5_COPMA|nr:hypothetical protein FA15DRAFT_710363 [Coprinopsis marcescibilis]